MIVQTNMNQMKQQNMGEDFMNIAREYQRKIEDELREICKETIDLVECKLLPRLLGGAKRQKEQEEGVQENRSDEEEHHHNESPKTVAMLLTEAASRCPV